MIDFNILIALISYYFVMYVTPGPNNAMVLASGLKFGFNKTIPHNSGITIGHVTQLICVCFGLVKIFNIIIWYIKFSFSKIWIYLRLMTSFSS